MDFKFEVQQVSREAEREVAEQEDEVKFGEIGWKDRYYQVKVMEGNGR